MTGGAPLRRQACLAVDEAGRRRPARGWHSPAEPPVRSDAEGRLLRAAPVLLSGVLALRVRRRRALNPDLYRDACRGWLREAPSAWRHFDQHGAEDLGHRGRGPAVCTASRRPQSARSPWPPRPPFAQRPSFRPPFLMRWPDVRQAPVSLLCTDQFCAKLQIPRAF
jgi:hypothetical protein